MHPSCFTGLFLCFALMALPDLEDALTHLQHKEVDAAISVLEDKIEALPAHLTAHVLLARAYEAKRDWRRALTYWENVRFLMPSSPVGREGKTRVLRQLDTDEPASSSTTSASSASAPDSPSDDAPDSSSTEADDPDVSSQSPPSSTNEISDADSPSGLDELRQQAEEEARQGGARAGLADPSSAPDTADTPEDRVDRLEAEDDNLDRLIDQLESARIEPDPDVEDVPEPDLEDDVDDIVSETLARIHESQEDYRKAAKIYLKLASQEPEKTRPYLEKAAEMRERAEAQEESDA